MIKKRTWREYLNNYNLDLEYATLYGQKMFQTRIDINKEMISIEDRYFSLNRALLLVVGLWPYKKSKFAQLQYICFLSILLTFIIFQVYTNTHTHALTHACTHARTHAHTRAHT